MLTERGVVVRKTHEGVCVETQIKSACASCSVKEQCGTGVVARAFSNKTQVHFIPSSDDIHIGQKVDIGISENAIVAASFWTYLVPVFSLILSAAGLSWMSEIFSFHEIFVVLGSLLGGYSGFVFARLTLSTRTKDFEPEIIKPSSLSK